jgi:hypothetical protein
LALKAPKKLGFLSEAIEMIRTLPKIIKRTEKKVPFFYIILDISICNEFDTAFSDR